VDQQEHRADGLDDHAGQSGPVGCHQFLGPTPVYSNACVGESNLGGTPEVSVDPLSKTVLLSFRGPAPKQCTLIYMPVAGLQGDFGPLASGDWTFKCLVKDIAFELKFTVGKGRVAYRVDKDARPHP
jgi:hypothetical protein